MNDENSITVDVVSDVVCPWCFIGQKRLDKAIAAVDIDVHIRWRPFQL
ncbi:MAG: disulfide bond formation protein DsbA, partial [Mesorhizobium sp.]